jgi:thioredoxin-dependent peroxiredoxin
MKTFAWAFLPFAFILGCESEGGTPPAASATPTTAAPAQAAPLPTPPLPTPPLPTPTPAAAPVQAATPDSMAVGSLPPDFTTTAQDGTPVHLAALKGKPVVVYFYPKDETPGCTKEACSFRDAWDALSKKGVVLIGLSADTDESHKAFASHYKLPFLFVSDKDGKIAALFGVPFQGGYTARQSFVIGADGHVKKVYRKVDVTVHAQEILADLE